jgi:hypothetical protein
MCQLLRTHKKEIERYCKEQALDAAKVFLSPYAGNDMIAVLNHPDPRRGEQGLLDETPAAITLKIIKNGDQLEFQQTEHTRQYLS